VHQMSKQRSMWCGLLGAALACGAPALRAAPMAAGHGHVAGWVANAAIAGAPSDDLAVQIAVHLAAKDAAGLKNLVAAVSDPDGKRYGQYLSPAQFADRYAPSAVDVAAVQQMLARAGMTEIEVGAQGMYVTATATVRQLRQTFNVGQTLYRYKGKLLRANDSEPALPAALVDKILYVEGLDDTTALRKPFHRAATRGRAVAPNAAAQAQALAAAPGITPPPVAAGNPSPYCSNYFGEHVATLSSAAGPYGNKIPWLMCGYTPQQIRAAYGMDQVKYDGKGVTIAIVDAYASPTLQADANRYAANHGLPTLNNKNFSQIIPKGIYNLSVSDIDDNDALGWWGEQSLDIAAVHGSAPGAKILYVGAKNPGPALDAALFNVLYNHLADVVTNSFGDEGEGGLAPGNAAAYDQALMAAAAMGTTVLFSSGDDGDLLAINGYASGAFPATATYATGVGGTSLALTDASGAKSEYGWGTFRALLADAQVDSMASVTTSGLTKVKLDSGQRFADFSFYAGSGGGISLLYGQPAWQASVVPAELAYTLNPISGFPLFLRTPQRVSPDVAMVGDPYTGYMYGETFTIAGDPIADSGCTPISATQEYCEDSLGGTSLSSPLMAGVVAVMNQKRLEKGRSPVGFANPLFYRHGIGRGYESAGLNQISAPASPVSVLRGYAVDLTTVRVVTLNSVPRLTSTATINKNTFDVSVCGRAVCEGIDGVYNYTSNTYDWQTGTITPAGYNDVTGLGVPYMPKLIDY
jgi:subtilase family serine protease